MKAELNYLNNKYTFEGETPLSIVKQVKNFFAERGEEKLQNADQNYIEFFLEDEGFKKRKDGKWHYKDREGNFILNDWNETYDYYVMCNSPMVFQIYEEALNHIDNTITLTIIGEAKG